MGRSGVCAGRQVLLASPENECTVVRFRNSVRALYDVTIANSQRADKVRSFKGLASLFSGFFPSHEMDQRQLRARSAEPHLFCLLVKFPYRLGLAPSSLSQISRKTKGARRLMCSVQLSTQSERIREWVGERERGKEGRIGKQIAQSSSGRGGQGARGNK